MFRTIKDAEVDFPSEFDDGFSGTKYWKYLSLRIHVPWFYIIYDDGESDPEVSMLLVSGIEDLLDLFPRLQHHVLQVYLISPGYMNESSRCEMNLIKYILEGKEPNINHEQSAYVYVLENNKRLVESALETREMDLLNIHLIRKFVLTSLRKDTL